MKYIPFYLLFFGSFFSFPSYGQQNTLLEQTIGIIEMNYYDTAFNQNNWELMKNEYFEKNISSSREDNAYLTSFIKEFGDKGVRHLNKSAFSTFMNEITGDTHVGIGLQEMYGVDINQQTGAIEIINTLPNSPAEKAGIMPNDIITTINGTSTKGWSLQDVMQKLRVDENEAVTITLKRKQKTKSYTLKGELLEPIVYPYYRIIEEKDQKVGLIWIPQFSQRISVRILQILQGFEQENVDKLILDLRNNPGGFVGEARAMLGIFIGEKPIAHAQSRINSIQMMVSIGKQQFDKPMIVLTNEGTASAAELAASTLQHYKRATVIGTNTKGKGLVYSFLGLSDQSVIILPVTRMITLQGRDITTQGVQPDIMFRNKKPFKLQRSYKKDKQLKKALKTF